MLYTQKQVDHIRSIVEAKLAGKVILFKGIETDTISNLFDFAEFYRLTPQYIKCVVYKDVYTGGFIVSSGEVDRSKYNYISEFDWPVE